MIHAFITPNIIRKHNIQPNLISGCIRRRVAFLNRISNSKKEKQHLPLLLLSQSTSSSFSSSSSSFPKSITASNMTANTPLTYNENSNNIDTVVVPPISSKILSTLDPCVVLMKQLIGKYSHLWEAKDGIFSLAQGVVYWDPPESSNQAIKQAFAQTPSVLHTYCPDEGIPDLRDAIIQKIAIENNLRDHNVMITSGANQAYMNCVLTILENGNKAVVFAPYYFNHVMALQMTMNDHKEDLLIGPINTQKGEPDLIWLQQQFEYWNCNSNNNNITKNKDASSIKSSPIQLVTITNPGNPTGAYLSRTYMEQVVSLCRTYNCWLVIDATYEYFIHANQQQQHQYYDGCFGTDPHVIHIFSFSKSYSLAGYRCGYVVIHNDAKIKINSSKSMTGTTTTTTTTTTLFEQMLKVQDTIPICPSRIGQIASFGAIQAGREWVLQKFQTLQPSRDAILDALKPLQTIRDGLDSTNDNENIIMGGSGAMYVMGKLPSKRIVSYGEDNQVNKDNNNLIAMDDVEVATKLVRDYGVAVIPGSFCGFPGWIRVCYSNLPPHRCLIAAKRLKDGLTNIIEWFTVSTTN